MASITTYAETMLSAFESVLEERMHEGLEELIMDSIMESISPVVKLRKGNTTIYINSDDYGLNEIAHFIIQNMDEETTVIIDGIDIMDFS